MAISEYIQPDFVLVAREVKKGESGINEFTVQVFNSPQGEGEPELRSIPSNLSDHLRRLERRKLSWDEIIHLGEALADLLLPSKARELLTRSLEALKSSQGLRIRLRLDHGLAKIPWEYINIRRGSENKAATGFLALDPRLSIVRHEALPLAGNLNTTPKARRLLVALASPEDYEPLNLTQERADIENALKDIPGMIPDFLENATVQGLSQKLLRGADIFHFAGHGFFNQAEVDKSAIVLVNQDKKSAPVPADQLAVNLRGRGVQLVILGACETGRRDEQNVWSGVVAALLAAGIPAAVAMQYKIWDKSASVFSQSFYRALAAGLPLDQAVTSARLEVFNLCHALRDDPNRQQFWRDWGVPVLYLRTAQDFVLPAITDTDQREAVAAGPRIVVDHRFGEIGAKGKYVAVEAGVIAGGTIKSYLKVGTVKGEVTQVEAEAITNGGISTFGEAEVVEDKWTAVKLGTVGEARTATKFNPTSQPTAAGLTCSNCHKPVQASWKFCTNCRTPLSPGPKYCAQCSAELPADARFCPQCNAEVG